MGPWADLDVLGRRNVSHPVPGIEPRLLPPSCADCLEIWEPEPPGTLRACPGL
jgi:hypothetical protein